MAGGREGENKEHRIISATSDLEWHANNRHSEKVDWTGLSWQVCYGKWASRVGSIDQGDIRIFYKEDSCASEGFRIMILKVEGTDTSSLSLDNEALSWNLYCNYKHCPVFIIVLCPLFSLSLSF